MVSDNTSMTARRMATKRQRGFTLIELMITVAVVAILTTIAVASYDFAVVKTRRGAAASCLMEAAQAMERRYTTDLTYVGAAAPSCSGVDQLNGFYAVPSFSGTPTARTYTLQVIPQGSQASRDTKCGTLSVNQAGVKGESGTASNASECF